MKHWMFLLACMVGLSSVASAQQVDSVTVKQVPRQVMVDSVTVWRTQFDTVVVSDSTPPDTGTVAVCPAANVDTEAELDDALASAGPGDVISMAPGVYSGRFDLTADGTEAQPILLCGPSTAEIVDNGGGYALHIDGARWWVVRGITIRNGLKGIMTDNAQDNVIEGVTVRDIAGECIHLRQNSRRNKVLNNYVHHCGLESRYGEGIYVGSSPNNYDNDSSHANVIEGNRIEYTASDAIDIKEATRRNIVRGNYARHTGPGKCALDGTGCTSGSNTTAVISGRPGDAVIECNDLGLSSGVTSTVAIYSGGNSGDGDNNVIRYNKTGPIMVHSTQVGNEVTGNTPDGYEAHCS